MRDGTGGHPGGQAGDGGDGQRGTGRPLFPVDRWVAWAIGLSRAVPAPATLTVSLARADGSRLRLLDLVHRGAALLLFDDGRLPGWNAAAIEALVGDLPDVSVYRLLSSPPPAAQPADLVDAKGTLWPRWRPAPGGAALVRPGTWGGLRCALQPKGCAPGCDVLSDIREIEQ